MSRSVDDEAVRVAIAARAVDSADAWRLAESLAIWAVTLERMATTSPQYHLDMARGFPDHPEFGQHEPRVRQRAMTDLVAFLAIGDMVLDDVARTLLSWLGQPVDPRAAAWNHLLDWADTEAAAGQPRVAVRRLQVSLRDARHRLVAHRRPDQGALFSWAQDHTPEVHLVPDQIDEPTRVGLLALNQRLRAPVPITIHTTMRQLLERISSAAPMLTATDLRTLSRLMREAGYNTFPIRDVVNDVLVISHACQGTPAPPVP